MLKSLIDIETTNKMNNMLLWMSSMKEQHIMQDLFVVGGFMKQITKNRNEIK